MAFQSVNAPLSAANCTPIDVWFEGNGSTTQTVYEGQGVCYNYDYGTAATETFARLNRVELPSITNARYFAGVLASNYTIPATGRVVSIYVPGSHCRILSKANTTLGSGILTCEAGGTYAGYWRYAGFEGEGSAVPLQTVDRSSTAGICQAYLQCGTPSGLVEVPTLTAAGGAHTFMVGGVTIFDTAVTLAANATFTQADSTISGQKKMWKCMATMTTSDIVITVTSGLQGFGNADPTAALNTITVDADNEEVELTWYGTEANGHWYVTGVLGSVLS